MSIIAALAGVTSGVVSSLTYRGLEKVEDSKMIKKGINNGMIQHEIDMANNITYMSREFYEKALGDVSPLVKEQMVESSFEAGKENAILRRDSKIKEIEAKYNIVL